MKFFWLWQNKPSYSKTSYDTLLKWVHNSKSLVKNSGIDSLHIPICFFGALIGGWASNSHFLSL
jgi:hypothetical protein